LFIQPIKFWPKALIWLLHIWVGSVTNFNYPTSYYIGSLGLKLKSLEFKLGILNFVIKKKIKICLFDAMSNFDSMIGRHDIYIYLLKIALLPFQIAHSVNPTWVNSRSAFFNGS